MADTTKKFVDFSGLDYFWSKAKAFVESADAALDTKITGVSDRVTVLEGVKDAYRTADAQVLADAKAYTNEQNAADATRMLAIESDVDALQATVGDANSGLVADVAALQDELDSLSGGAGSIDTQITNKIATLDVDDAAVAGQYVSSVAQVDGKISVVRAALPDYTEVYDAKGAADGALASAKSYADGLAGNYDAAGAAATAEQNAKDYADGLDDAMDARVAELEAIDHDALAAAAAASAVATVLDGAPEAFDTLKEVAAWIADNDHADDVAALVTDVANLKAIDHDAYKAYADQAEADAISAAATDAASKYQVKGNYEAAGAAAAVAGDLADHEADTVAHVTAAERTAWNAAEQNAKDYADGLAGNYDAAGAAADAQAAAIADAASKYQVKGNYEAAGAAATALADAKAYTDSAIAGLTFATNADIDSLFA